MIPSTSQKSKVSAALTRLEEKNSNLAQVEVDKVLGLVGDIWAEVTANNAVPCWVVLFVEFLLDVGGNVLFNVVLLQRLGGTVNRVLLHVLRHISVLNDSFTIRHSISQTKSNITKTLVNDSREISISYIPDFFFVKLKLFFK